MKGSFVIVFCMLFGNASSQLSDSEIRNLKRGHTTEDSSYVYWLPYENGKKYLFVQGANSKFSHKDELSFDFKMAKGSKVCAVRDGLVTAIKSDSDKGGFKDEYLDDGNHIVIQHADGSIAQYWHLEKDGVVVNVGDSVTQGQIIGLSGNTGDSAFPHLHFQLIGPNGKQILPRFKTRKGVLYIRPGRWYKSVNR